MHLIDGPLIAAAIGFSVYRQMMPRRAGGKAVVMPLILFGYGVYTAFLAAQATGLVDQRHLVASVLLLVLGLAVEAGLGVWRGATVRAWREADGSVWRKGTPKTLALWAVTVAIRVGLALAGAYLLQVTEPMGALLIGVAITLGAQNLVVTVRAARLPVSAGVSVA